VGEDKLGSMPVRSAGMSPPSACHACTSGTTGPESPNGLQHRGGSRPSGPNQFRKEVPSAALKEEFDAFKPKTSTAWTYLKSQSG
jgi:hypothetical protein